MQRPADKVRIALYCGGALIGLLVAIFGVQFVLFNQDFFSIVAGVFATFAGFLVAVQVLLGDPSTLIPGSSHELSAQKKEMQRRSRRLQAMFVVVTVAMTLSIIVSGMSEAAKTGQIEQKYYYWATSALLFSVVFSIALLLDLSRLIALIQNDRLDALVTAQRNKEKSRS